MTHFIIIVCLASLVQCFSNLVGYLEQFSPLFTIERYTLFTRQDFAILLVEFAYVNRPLAAKFVYAHLAHTL